jgi:hypothetical protein
MPKSYKLKSDEELAAKLREQAKRDDGTGPIDWAHEAAVDDIKRFFLAKDAAGEPQQERPGGSKRG